MKRALLRVPWGGLAQGDLRMPDDAGRYATRVHRLAVGEAFVAFDPTRALEAEATIVSVDRTGVVAKVGLLRPAAVRATRRLTLLQGMGKGDKLDAVVRDATELGATRVVPVLTERSVARPQDGEARRERLVRVAVEAARQAGRGDAPEVTAPCPLGVALASYVVEGVAGVALDPRATTPLGRVLPKLTEARDVVVLVGPEGGLADAELHAAEATGLVRTSLGPFVLRTETVAAAVLGALLVAREG